MQKALISLALVGFPGLLVVSVLDCRFGWSSVPAWLSVLGNAFVALGLMMNLVVFARTPTALQRSSGCTASV